MTGHVEVSILIHDGPKCWSRVSVGGDTLVETLFSALRGSADYVACLHPVLADLLIELDQAGTYDGPSGAKSEWFDLVGQAINYKAKIDEGRKVAP